jgi:hypothetical protein
MFGRVPTTERILRRFAIGTGYERAPQPPAQLPSTAGVVVTMSI